jgi:hypothetical protein
MSSEKKKSFRIATWNLDQAKRKRLIHELCARLQTLTHVPTANLQRGVYQLQTIAYIRISSSLMAKG